MVAQALLVGANRKKGNMDKARYTISTIDVSQDTHLNLGIKLLQCLQSYL